MFQVKQALKIITISLFVSVNIAAAQKMKLDTLSIEPKSLETKLDQEHEFVVHGGKGPYIFKTSAGMIRYRDNVATYVSPSTPGDATITVKDSTGVTKTVKITVMPDEQSQVSE